MSSLQKNIRGRDYAFGVIPPIEAIHVEVAIAKVIGEPLFKTLMTGGGGKMSKDELAVMAAMAMGQMMSRMDAAELIKTMETVFTYCTCNGARININSTFVGRNRELWEVFWEALKHNFSDFLPESLSHSLPEILQRG
jgi:hypothetical protein